MSEMEAALGDAATWERKTPDLSRFDAATPEEVRIANLFTRIQFTLVRGEPNAHNVWLEVDNQSFRLDLHSEDAIHASWRCWMLAKAILKVLRMEPERR
jgi:hypothetical protein